MVRLIPDLTIVWLQVHKLAESEGLYREFCTSVRSNDASFLQSDPRLIEICSMDFEQSSADREHLAID
eukprot:CAMPEP_0203753192 /NCGR_PEP_ID=MMETSP0098-20131031/6998_1 /ASSEMBLY_ACC=CAM_ASM_000208 /TAXON_ID=96639 /ORGANISM=" , Strain NY0313808BC1" /LENGTH=67 /DNA_ID=CAMNT_0050643677 /DNA_START=125 /DNA_END=328 /DNA_ORIENTATION=-